MNANLLRSPSRTRVGESASATRLRSFSDIERLFGYALRLVHEKLRVERARDWTSRQVERLASRHNPRRYRTQPRSRSSSGTSPFRGLERTVATALDVWEERQRTRQTGDGELFDVSPATRWLHAMRKASRAPTWTPYHPTRPSQRELHKT